MLATGDQLSVNLRADLGQVRKPEDTDLQEMLAGPRTETFSSQWCEPLEHCTKLTSALNCEVRTKLTCVPHTCPGSLQIC